jgi:predicted ArsR family transcriptional regulator
MREDFDNRIHRLAALGEPIRRALYRFVAGRPRPVSRDEAAEGLGVPRHVAKFHLDRLEEDGLLEAEFRRPPGRSGPGAGRPSKLYRRAPGELSVSLPDRRYELAGRLLADAISVASRERVPVHQALSALARQFGSDLGDSAARSLGPPASTGEVLDAVGDVLDATGYEPRPDEDGLVLANCPFHALAREHTELVCGMNLDIIDAMVERLPGGTLEARLEPAPDRCCVKVCPRSTR